MNIAKKKKPGWVKSGSWDIHTTQHKKWPKKARKGASKSPQKRPTKKRKQKEKYLVNLKREKALATKGWKVARTMGYLKQPKKAIGKKGYPYAVLNKESHYETFYTWKEKSSKKKKR